MMDVRGGAAEIIESREWITREQEKGQGNENT
jgi:hypothetical protein